MNSSGRWRVVGAASAIVLVFLGALWEVIASSAPEMDLWWYVPTVLFHAAEKSAWATLVYLLQPGPLLFESPAMKFFPWLIQGWLQWPFGLLVLASVLLHVANAGWVFRVGQQLGLSRRSCFFSALLFLSLFIHFHAYLWPTAVHHVLAVFSILTLLHLYLKTEEKIECDEPRWRVFYGLTLLAAAAASLQRSTLFAPLLILAHLWVMSKSPQERGIRYDRWAPLFVLYPIYSILGLSFVGDLVTTTRVSEMALSPMVKAGLLFGGAGASIAAGGWLIRRKVAPRLLGVLGVVGFLLLFPLRDKREVLFAYNALVPFVSVLASFLDPFGAALEIDSTVQYHFVPPQISGWALSLTVLSLALFWALFVRRQKGLWVLFVWYAACLAYVLLHPHVASSFPVRIVSRYFIYFTPVVAWVISAVLIALFDLAAQGSRGKPAIKGLLLSGLVAAFCCANLLAIRVAVFRGRFFNTYGIYDDIRVARLLRDALAGASRPSGGVGGVVVNGMVPLHYVADLEKHLPAGGIPFENFKLLASDALRDLPVDELHVNPAPPFAEGALVFQIVGTDLKDSSGRSMDPFSERFERGLAEAALGRPAEALRLFQQAAAERPFLLRYLLGPCRLEDARWITRGTGLREWLEEVIRRYQAEQSVGSAKQEQTAAVVRRELADYALCLLHLAYLKHREGFEEESQRWLTQLRHLEPDPEFLVEWIGQHPRIRSDRGIGEFLQRVKDPFQWGDLTSRERVGDGFGPFLIRLIFHINFLVF